MINNETISVTVKFFATLRIYGPAKETLTIPKNSKINILFEKYKIPSEERRTIIMVNGRPHKDQSTLLKDGDIIAIFPPIGGG
ncbi:MAG: MoaD/ThiS family protein [Candidatus Hodarchaeota archaeon]